MARRKVNRWHSLLSRLAFGLFLGIVLGFASLGRIQATEQMKALGAALVFAAALCYAISFFPVVGWLGRSAQRGLLPGLKKAKVEAFLWQTAVTVVCAVCLVRAIFGPP